MTPNRTLIAQFCDDVRQEIGNKFSLMGCYGSDLFVPEFPITLPKLCVFTHVRRSLQVLAETEAETLESGQFLVERMR